MQTRDFGRAFFHVIDIRPGTPLFHDAATVEIEPPYRRSHSLVVRVPYTLKAVVLGWWRDVGWDPEEALMEAVKGWGIDPYDENLGRSEVRQTIRENLATRGLDADSEWQIISALGVEE